MSNRPAKPYSDYPLFAHASGQWAKKIDGKTVYFGAWAFPKEALDRCLERGQVMLTGKSKKHRAASQKPSKDFPLFKHASGQWAKKIRGRMYYFGTDADAAEKRFDSERADLYAGRPRVSVADPTGLNVADLCNRYLTLKQRQMNSGELSPRTWRDYHRCCAALVKQLHEKTLVENLTPDDFDKLRAKLAVKLGPVALAKEVQMIRSVFKVGLAQKWLSRAADFGDTFRKPKRKELRKARRDSGSRMLEAKELRSLIDAAGQPLRAMILLGLNCGFGQTDVASLPITAVNLKMGWVDFPRPKTAIDRRIPLWRETVKAIREALATRPLPKDPAAKPLIFVTAFGRPWVRVNVKEDGVGVAIDAVGLEYGKLLAELNLKRRGGFYNLRHVHRTIAGRAHDREACDAIMGHQKEDDMSLYYIEEAVADERLLAVVNHVRSWLWPRRQKRRR